MIKRALREVLAAAAANGYAEIDGDELKTLLIEYTVDGMGCGQDVDKRYALQDRMNETLGWTGVGHCDGGSIGSGTTRMACEA